MTQILYGIEIAAIFASSLVCSCLGLVALGKFAFDLTKMLRGDIFNLPSADDVRPNWISRRGGFRDIARLLALLAASAILFWLSYALARWTMAPIR
jgi:hypothetical protein